MKKFPLVVREEYDIWAEPLWFGNVLHSEVHRWGSHIRRAFREDLQSIVTASVKPCFAFVPPSDPKTQNKLRKFIRSVGGSFDHRRKDGHGDWGDLYIFRSFR